MEKAELNILLTEDDQFTLRTSKRLLSRFGTVIGVTSYQEAIQLMESRKFDIAFFDINLGGKLSGLELVKAAGARNLYSVVISGESRKTIFETAFINGAKNYLLKPFNDEKLDQVWSHFINSRKSVEFENIIIQNFLTKSQSQLNELYKLKNLTISHKPIFINGETGTGKRVIAHIIKSISISGPFIELNCSQFSDELIASELFGHVKGSFTGASDNKIGLLEKANNGIIFLDEIHALSLRSQKTLLKAIEEKEFYPVGSNKPVRSNFRVIAATCEDINQMIDAGKFRQDLFARISTFQIKLLPLRERREDIELLLEHYISKHLIQIYINDEAKKVLYNYSWPRNTREIEDLVENWVVNGHRLITPELLPMHLKYNILGQNKFIPDSFLDMVEEHGLNEFMIFLKKEIVSDMVKRNGGSIRKAAGIMGASYSNLSTFLKQNKSLNLTSGGIQ